MKTLAAAFCLFLLAITLNASEGPTSKGSFILDGSISFTLQSGDLYRREFTPGDSLEPDESYKILSLMPSVGFFVADNIMVGGTITIERKMQYSLSYSTFLFGPEIGYFLSKKNDGGSAKGSFIPYIKGFFQIGQIQDKSVHSLGTGDIDTKYSKTRFGGKIGTVLMLSNAIGLDINLLYSHDKMSMNDAPDDYEAPSGDTIKFGVGLTGFVF